MNDEEWVEEWIEYMENTSDYLRRLSLDPRIHIDLRESLLFKIAEINRKIIDCQNDG